MQELDFPFDSNAVLRNKKKYRRLLLSNGNNRIKKRVAILGGSTTNDIKLILELFLLNYGIEPEFYESEYNQYYEDAMFGNTELDEFSPELVYLHTSWRNVKNFPSLDDGTEVIKEKLNGEFDSFVSAWQKLQNRYNCIIIQNNFEFPNYRLLGNKEASDIHGRINYLSKLNIMFYEFSNSNDKFYINDINYLSSTYGLDEWGDAFYWHMYKYSLCIPAIPILAHNVANIMKSIYGKNKKAFVLDLDNTLWGGVIGDDGVDEIETGQETPTGQVYNEFQKYVKDHKSLGVLLCVASKNENDVALEGLNSPDCLLSPDDFVSIKANWEPKSKNIIETANELNLLPESFVFIDDNPAEREIVRQQVPGVSVPELDKAEHYLRIIDKSGFFETTSITEDDTNRNKMYTDNQERAKLQSSFTDYNDFLISLNMVAEIIPFNNRSIPRVTQLINKSNQFNLTTKRLSQQDVEETASSSSYITLSGRLEDKFGDNGIVSVVIGKIDNSKLHIELWLMSCRVLKRDMECAMMDALVSKCKETGLKEIIGYYYPTEKNKMVINFYKQQGFELLSDDNGSTIWSKDVDKYINKNNVISLKEIND